MWKCMKANREQLERSKKKSRFHHHSTLLHYCTYIYVYVYKMRESIQYERKYINVTTNNLAVVYISKKHKKV